MTAPSATRPLLDAASPRRVAVPPRPVTPRTIGFGAVITAVIVVAHVLAIRDTDFAPDALVRGSEGMARFISEAFPPDLSAKVLVDGARACLITLWIGLLGTTLSIPATIVLSMLGSRATAFHPVIYQLARGLMSFLRAVPDIVFALIFVTAVGLGPFAGVLAIVCHNVGVMGKLWSEAMEAVDHGPADALRIAGARRAQVIVHATIPAVLTQVVGLLLYRFEVNVRSSLVLGLVGAGGVGFLINQSIQLFRFDELLTYILMVVVLVITVDLLSALVRRRLQ